MGNLPPPRTASLFQKRKQKKKISNRCFSEEKSHRPLSLHLFKGPEEEEEEKKKNPLSCLLLRFFLPKQRTLMATSLSSPSPRRFLSLIEPNSHLSVLSLLCLFVLFSLSIFLYRKKKKNPTKPISSRLSIFPVSFSPPLKGLHQESKPLFVQILTSPHCPKWAVPNETSSNVVDGSAGNSPRANGSEPDLDADAAEDFGEGGRELKGKRKKRRGKKKRQNPRAEDDGGGGREEDEGRRENHAAAAAGKPTIECLYPFTSSTSATQRKIKLHYDELVKSNEAKALTMAQVGQFANCLIEARNELQHKSEIIQRRFTITKALLFKADRSSFDRLCQQIYKLEAEQKRLEEDATVYNRLQEQLKLSPAYKKAKKWQAEVLHELGEVTCIQLGSLTTNLGGHMFLKVQMPISTSHPR